MYMIQVHDMGVTLSCTCMVWLHHCTVYHYGEVIMGMMASQITSLTIVYLTIYSGADQRKHQSSASLAFVRGIHRGPVNSPHKWPVTRKMFPFDDVIMATNVPWFYTWYGWAILLHKIHIYHCTDMKVHPYAEQIIEYTPESCTGLMLSCIFFKHGTDNFTHIHQDYFTNTGAKLLPNCKWSNPEEYG